MDEFLVWIGAAVALLLGFYLIERSGILGNPCSCGGGGDANAAPASASTMAGDASCGGTI